MTSSKKDNDPKYTLREKVSAYIDLGLILGQLACAGILIQGPPEFAGIALRTSDGLNRLMDFRLKRKGRASS